MYRKIVYVFLLTFCMISCLEPYDVDITDYEDLLVVDALITDEVKNHRVYLSRSVPNLDETPEVETGALVIITDENDNEEILTEITPGVYETDKLQFTAREGGTYILSIRTSTGETYRSSPCTLLPPSSIDKVYFKAAKEWNIDETEELYGVNILVDGSSYEGGYVRWLYDEDWKFRVPFPTMMEYNDDLEDWERISPINVTCWKENISKQVVIHSFGNQNSAVLKDKKVCFVPSEVTDKLSVRYSILVKQLSISKEEYEFWNKLKISTEDVGNVFGTQPFSIKGNVKNINNPKEPVLGYFQTGSAVTHRIYIDRHEIDDLELPIIKYDHGCRVDSFIADGLSYNTPLEIYESLVLSGAYNLYDAIYSENSMAVIGLLLTRPVCSDCTITGTDQQPDFWED